MLFKYLGGEAKEELSELPRLQNSDARLNLTLVVLSSFGTVPFLNSSGGE